MAEKAEKSSKKSWFDGLKAEFKKIIWPDRKSLVKQTGARRCRFYRAWSDDCSSGFYFPVRHRHSGEYQFLNE